MDSVQRFVTLGGECFEAKFQRKQTALPNRLGTYHLFLLRDVRDARGDRLVSVFVAEMLGLHHPQFDDRLESVTINVVRRAFDAGQVSFDESYDEHKYKPLDVADSDLGTHTRVSDQEIRRYLCLKAFWLSYMHPTHPGQHGILFETPDDLEYLGVQAATVRRNVLRLQNQGLLDKTGKPTEKLIAAYESSGNEGDGTLHSMSQTDDQILSAQEVKPDSHEGLLVFISHSSKDVDLAIALIELLRDGLGLSAKQIRCSSVDGYRLPVGVNSEDKLRKEVTAARVVVGLITPSSLASYYVMFELGARWGSNRFLAPLVAGVKPSTLSPPLSLLNVLDATNDSQLHQLLTDISKELDVRLQDPASYVRRIAAVKSLADKIPGRGSADGTARDEHLSPTTPTKLVVEESDPRIYVIGVRVEGALPELKTIFVIENRGGGVAHGVHIQPITLGYRRVSFLYIDNLGVNQKADIVIDREKVELQKRDMMAALDEECEAKAKAEGTAIPFGFTIRLVIKYRTFNNSRTFSADVDLNYYLGKRKWPSFSVEELFTFYHQGFKRLS